MPIVSPVLKPQRLMFRLFNHNQILHVALLSYCLIPFVHAFGQVREKVEELPIPKKVKLSSGQNYTYTKISNTYGVVTIEYPNGTKKLYESRIKSDSIFVPFGLVVHLDDSLRITQLYHMYPSGINGIYMSFYDDGIKLKRVCEYKNDKSEGIYREFYKNGIMSVAGRMSHKGRVGTWYFYYPSGQLKEFGIYKTHKINKRNKEQYIDYINNWIGDKYVFLKEGTWVKYLLNGQEAERCVFHRGKCLTAPASLPAQP